jgi:hypothetical protein
MMKIFNARIERRHDISYPHKRRQKAAGCWIQTVMAGDSVGNVFVV